MEPQFWLTGTALVALTVAAAVWLLAWARWLNRTNMLPEEKPGGKLSLRGERAVRDYLVKLLMVPSAIVTGAAFILGFLIRDVAGSRADIAAEGAALQQLGALQTEIASAREGLRRSEATYDELNRSRNNIDTMFLAIDSLAEEVAPRAQRAQEIIRDLEGLEARANELADQVASAEALVLQEDFREAIADTLLQDTTFANRVAAGTGNVVTRVDSLYAAVGRSVCLSTTIPQNQIIPLPNWGLSIYVDDVNPPDEVDRIIVRQGNTELFSEAVERGTEHRVGGYTLSVPALQNNPDAAVIFMCRDVGQ